MRKRFLLLSGILLLIAAYGYAQDLPTIKPPPPTAMQFQKYGDYPVSHFTGVPDITIPLYTIKEGDLEVPITLSYHASGYKPTDVDGIAGLGWVLNVGGQMTRTIYDKEDEQTLPPNYGPMPTESYVNNIVSSWNGNWNSSNYLKEIESKYHYDIFSYDFMGKHGKFILKDYRLDQCLLLDYQPISIQGTLAGHRIGSFTVKDEMGKKYIFEQTTISGFNTSDTWSLSSLQSAIDATNIITYSFTTGPTVTYRSRVDTYTKDDNESDPSLGTCSGGQYPIDIYDEMPFWSDEIYTGNIENGFQSVAPSQINFRNGRVQFVYDPVTKMLSAMDVYNNNNELLKRVRFELYKPNAWGGRAYSFLNKVKLYDRYDNFVNEHVFKYNNENVGVPESGVPIDYWGYFNANDYSEGDLIPRFFIEFHDWYGNNPSKVVGTSYRQSSENHMKVFQLNEIIYPTGGRSVFEFEANQYYGWDGPLPSGYEGTAVGGLRIKRILNYSDANTLASVKDYEYLQSRMDIIPSRHFFTRSSTRFIIMHSMGIVYSYRRTEVSSDPLVNIAPHGSPVVYPNVREHIRKILPDGTIDMSSLTTQTINYLYDWQPFNPYSFPTTNGNEGEGFYPLYAAYASIIKANTDGKLLNVSYSGPSSSSTSYEYEEIPLEELHTFYSSRYAFYQAHPCANDMSEPDYWFYQTPWGTDCHLNYGDVTIKPMIKRLKSTIETQHGGVNTRTEYHYDNNTHDQPTSKTVTTSTGETIKTTYQYPHEKQSGNTPNVYNDMVSRHIWSPVVEEATYKAGTPDQFLHSLNTNYDYWENNTWASGSANSLIVPRTVQTTAGTGPTETRIRFSAYDDKANVLSVAKENNVKMTYVWGYNKSYPIAEVTNAEATDVFHTSFEDESDVTIAAEGKTGRKSKIGGFSKALTNLTDGSYTLSYWQKSGNNWTLITNSVNVTDNAYTINISGQVDEVRFYPSAAFITTFTFDPLIGKTSEANANDRTEYYEYDPALRLMHILDEDRNVLKKFSYSFYNSATASATAPNWQNTGNSYCESCNVNSAFNNGYKVSEQIDNNPNSYTYGQKRWFREQNSACGTFNDYWQNTDNYMCVTDGGINTGERKRQQVFINPCYQEYQYTRWVSLGINTNACPVPTVYESQDLSGYYSKGNCPADHAGGQVYVSVPAAMFNSPSSLLDANAQALAYAQSVADSSPSGTCTPIPFMLQCDNQTEDDIEVMLYDNSTGTSYSFTAQGDMNHSQDLGYILPGTYEVTFLNLDYPIPYYYYLNCGSIYGEGYNITIPDVTIGSNCNQIQILD